MVYKLNCYQLDDTWGSHHYPIETILDETVFTYKKRTNRLSTRKTDWVKYKNILQQKDENIKNWQINEDNWEVVYEKLVNELKRTVTLATRGTSVKKLITKRNEKEKEEDKKKKMDNKNRKERIPVKWWDIECDQVIKRKKDNSKNFRINTT